MKHSFQHGFTLVELAIALMVIGLLIGGVLKGQELIDNARVTQVMRELKAYDAAALIFRNTYGAYPGDIKKPQSRIPNCTIAPCITPGNGDGRIVGNHEQFNFFPHMTKAGMIKGPEGGTEEQMENVAADRAHADSELFFPKTALDFETELQYITLNGKSYNSYYIPPHNLASSTPMPIKFMIALDTKYDDGNPEKGSIVLDWIGDCPTTGNIGDWEYDLEYSGATNCPVTIAVGF